MSNYKTAKNKLDATFSKWIRLRDSIDGLCKCCSCPTVLPISEMTCGHYVNRGHLVTRWDESNCAAQCYPCNSKGIGDGMKEEHRVYIARQYGELALQKLDELKSNNLKYTTHGLEDLNKLFQSKIKRWEDYTGSKSIKL